MTDKKNYNNGLIKTKIFMLQAGPCDYSYAYILIKGIITVVSTGASNFQLTQEDIQAAFKNWAPFINRILGIHKTQVDEAKNRMELQNGSIRI